MTTHELLSQVIRESDIPLLNKIADIIVTDEQPSGEDIIDACKITFVRNSRYKQNARRKDT